MRNRFAIFVQSAPCVLALCVAVIDAVFLLCHTNKRGALGELFQARSANVGACRTQTAQNITYGIINRTAQRQFDRFPSAERYSATPREWRSIAEAELMP